MPEGFFLLLIAGMFFPIIALVGAVWFLLNGMAGPAFFLFIWWLLWAE